MNGGKKQRRAEQAVEVSASATADRIVYSGKADKNVGAPVGAPVGAKRDAATLMKRRVYETVASKREWEGPPEPAVAAIEKAISSKGWYTRGYLPHCDKPGTIQMVTFRLADAMPVSLRREWEDLLTIEDERERRTKLEAYLDLGRGECVLRDPRVAAAVETVFLCFDGQRYRMIAWVAMPNHAHLLFELWDMPMGELLKAWKGASANAANRSLGRKGTFWQEEYWDRYMRDEAHFRKAKHYIEWNPVKSGLVRTPELWAFSSANPKWQWSTEERYLRGQLLNKPPAPEPRARQADRHVRAPGSSERGHSCPPSLDAKPAPEKVALCQST